MSKDYGLGSAIVSAVEQHNDIPRGATSITIPIPNLKGSIRTAIATLIAWVKQQGSSFIDTPEERLAIEHEAVAAFNLMFGSSLGIAGTAILDGFVISIIDWTLVHLVQNQPVVVPTPVVPVTPPVTSTKDRNSI